MPPKPAREQILDDKWPQVDKKQQERIMKALKKASKARIFDYPREHVTD